MVEFAGADSVRRIGNFQMGHSYFTSTSEWPEAGRLIVIAKGALYLVSLRDPKRYVTGPSTVTSYCLSDERDLLAVADYCDLSVYEVAGRLRWRRRSLGIDGLEVTGVKGSTVRGRACIDPPEQWRSFAVRLSDGADA